MEVMNRIVWCRKWPTNWIPLNEPWRRKCKSQLRRSEDAFDLFENKHLNISIQVAFAALSLILLRVITMHSSHLSTCVSCPILLRLFLCVRFRRFPLRAFLLWFTSYKNSPFSGASGSGIRLKIDYTSASHSIHPTIPSGLYSCASSTRNSSSFLIVSCPP